MNKVPEQTSNLFIHYKGGRYRKLFEALTVLEKAGDDDVELFKALHADDRREVLVCIPKYLRGRPALVVDPLSGTWTEVVVYVSLTYGTIWVRRKAEFEGLVLFGGMEMRRFLPVESFEDRL